MSKQTKKYTTKTVAPGLAGINQAAELIKQGEVIAFPTETVYGLGADCFNVTALKKIYRAKGRPSDNPVIVHVASTEQVHDVANNVSETAKKLMDHFWPGPLTLVFEKKKDVPDIVTGGLKTVAVRIPQHHVAQAIIEQAGVPIAAPSANLSGKPSPTTAQAVLSDMDGKISLIIDSGPCEVGIESTVLDVTGKIPIILRPGMVTYEMLSEVIGQVDRKASDDEKAKSPGTKYSHYSPNANLTIIHGPQAAISRHILIKISADAAAGNKSGVMCYDQTKRNYSGSVISLGSQYNLKEVAKNLYEAFRKADEMALTNVYVEALDDKNEGSAIMNRLMHAANNQVEEI
ncbi:MAG: threonylcarbamoyl-AMP synthase [Clostridiales bacterium]|nr:threonylcarbamoyl-AMP synthase [Clostridiales bacterium]